MKNKQEPIECEAITFEEFENAFKEVMLKEPPEESKYENRQAYKKRARD